MSKIIFVGDPHLDNRTPISRLDTHADTTKGKLLNILKTALKHDVGLVVMLGDMFDKYDTSILYLNEIISIFKQFNDNGIEVYSIIGNHDLPYNNKKYFNQTPLSLLFSSNVVKHLTKLELDTVDIYGIDFTEMSRVGELNANLNKDKTSILCMHYATDNTVPYESIERDEFNNFDLVASGHDHNFYDYSITDKPIVLRPGSMVRRTKDTYNLNREPLIYIYDTTTKDIIPIKLEAKPSSEVFKSQVLLGGVSTFDPTSFHNVFNEAYFKKEALSLDDLINDLPIDITKETKDYLIKYFKSL